MKGIVRYCTCITIGTPYNLLNHVMSGNMTHCIAPTTILSHEQEMTLVRGSIFPSLSLVFDSREDTSRSPFRSKASASKATTNDDIGEIPSRQRRSGKKYCRSHTWYRKPSWYMLNVRVYPRRQVRFCLRGHLSLAQVCGEVAK